MAIFVPLRYSLPLPAAVTDLTDAAGIDAALDDIGIVSAATSESDELAFEVDATIAVRTSIDVAAPGLPSVTARLFAGIDPAQLNQFTFSGGWLREGGVEVEGDVPIELVLDIPGLRPAIVDADGPKPDPANPELRVEL